MFGLSDSKDAKKKEKKKEPNVEKIENCITYKSEDKVFVGFPTEVETKASAGGKFSFLGIGAKGEKYSKVKYDWKIISGKPLPEQEMKELGEKIATTSGTIVASLSNVSSVDKLPKCRNCGTPLLMNLRTQ